MGERFNNWQMFANRNQGLLWLSMNIIEMYAFICSHQT